MNAVAGVLVDGPSFSLIMDEQIEKAASVRDEIAPGSLNPMERVGRRELNNLIDRVCTTRDSISRLRGELESREKQLTALREELDAVLSLFAVSQ